MTPCQLVNSHDFSGGFLPLSSCNPRRVSIDSDEVVDNKLLLDTVNCLPLYMAPCHKSRMIISIAVRTSNNAKHYWFQRMEDTFLGLLGRYSYSFNEEEPRY
jgi:hypothetical protein